MECLILRLDKGPNVSSVSSRRISEPRNTSEEEVRRLRHGQRPRFLIQQAIQVSNMLTRAKNLSATSRLHPTTIGVGKSRISADRSVTKAIIVMSVKRK